MKNCVQKGMAYRAQPVAIRWQNHAQAPSPEIAVFLAFSPFFARCCGQMLEAKPQTDGTPYSCFKIHFVREYRNLSEKQNESRPTAT